MADLADRVALVTGAARGIGRATAIALAEAGAKVVVSDLATPIAELDYATGEAMALNETARLIAATGGEPAAVTADVRDFDALRRAVATAVESFDGLDIVVAN